MTLTVRTIDNPNPTQVYSGRRKANVREAVKKGGIIINLHEVPTIPNIDAAILAAVETEGCTLEMQNWHNGFDRWIRNGDKPPLCGTTNCRAGWAIHLCGKAGYALEKRYHQNHLAFGSGPHVAGTLIYAASDPEAVVPEFFPSKIKSRLGLGYYDKVEPIVMDDLRKRAARQLGSG